MHALEDEAHETTPDVDSVRRLCRLTATTLGTERAATCEFRADQTLHFLSTWPPSSEPQNSTTKVMGTLLGEETFCIVEDLGAHKPDLEPPQHLGFFAAAVLPQRDDSTPRRFLVATDSSPREFSTSSRPLLGDLAQTARDILDLKITWRQTAEAQQQLRQEHQKRKQLIAELESSNSKLEQFAYIASHDLQEPLRMVTGFLGLLKDEYGERLGEDADKYIEFAVDGAKRMKEMINDLLAYSRMWSSTEPFTPTDTEQIFVDARDELLRNHPDLTATIEHKSLPVVASRSTQIHRLFTNLLANALLHSGDEPCIEVWAEDRVDHHLFAVVDDGIGIPENQQQRIPVEFSGLLKIVRELDNFWLSLVKFAPHQDS